MSESEDLDDIYPSKQTFLPHYTSILSKQLQERKRLQQTYEKLRTHGDEHAHLNELGERCAKQLCHCDKLMDQPQILDTGRGFTTWQYYVARQRAVKQLIGFAHAIIEEEVVDDSLELADYEPNHARPKLSPRPDGGIAQPVTDARWLKTEPVNALLFPECLASSVPVPACTMREWHRRLADEGFQDRSRLTKRRVQRAARLSRRRAVSSCTPIQLRVQVDAQEGLCRSKRMYRHARESISVVCTDLKQDWAIKIRKLERSLGVPVTYPLLEMVKETFLELWEWTSDIDDAIARLAAACL